MFTSFTLYWQTRLYYFVNFLYKKYCKFFNTTKDKSKMACFFIEIHHENTHEITFISVWYQKNYPKWRPSDNPCGRHHRKFFLFKISLLWQSWIKQFAIIGYFSQNSWTINRKMDGQRVIQSAVDEGRLRKGKAFTVKVSPGRFGTQGTGQSWSTKYLTESWLVSCLVNSSDNSVRV